MEVRKMQLGTRCLASGRRSSRRSSGLPLRPSSTPARGRQRYPDGSLSDILPPEYHTPHHLLTGILRCGRIRPDGSLCNMPLRVTGHRNVKSYLYCCPSKAAGGCNGVARRGDLIDQYVSEAVLAKLEERTMTSRDTEGPPLVWTLAGTPGEFTEPSRRVAG